MATLKPGRKLIADKTGVVGAREMGIVEPRVAVMESRDLVTVSRPVFWSLGLEGFRCVSVSSFSSRDFA